MDNIDLNIENYTLDEIKTFFKLPLNPNSYNLNSVLQCEKQMGVIIKNDKNLTPDKSERIMNFLNKAKEKLVLDLKVSMDQHIKERNKQMMMDTTEFVIERDVGNVVNQTTTIAGGGGNSFVIDRDTTSINDVIDKKKYLNPIETYQTEIARSNLNNLKRKTIIQNVILNSLFREDYNNTTASNFQIQLPYQFKNVLSVRLSSIQLPNVLYCFSSKKMNNIMYIEEYINPYEDVESVNEMSNRVDDMDMKIAKDVIKSIPELDEEIDNNNNNNNNNNDPKQNIAENPNPNSNPPILTEEEFMQMEMQQKQFEEQNMYSCPPYPPYPPCPPEIIGGSIILPDGNYNTLSELAEVLQHEINMQLNIFPQRFKVIANEETQKLTIMNKYNYFNLNFLKDVTSNDFNGTLGWILGYRQREYCNEKSYTTEGIYNSSPTDYLFFVMNDFNHSQSQNIVAMYSENYIGNNILAMIPLKTQNYHISFNIGGIGSSNLIEKKREYFGPVNIKKIKIELRDQYGELVDLNNMDFSFSLEMELGYDW